MEKERGREKKWKKKSVGEGGEFINDIKMKIKKWVNENDAKYSLSSSGVYVLRTDRRTTKIHRLSVCRSNVVFEQKLVLKKACIIKVYDVECSIISFDK